MNISERIKNLIGNESQGFIKTKTDKNLSVEEQAVEFFKKIYGQDDIKFNIYLKLIREQQINVLMVGPPATSKTLFMECIKENCRDVIFFDAASGSSGAGLINLLKNNKTAKVLIIDELDKLKRNDTNVILGLLNNGSVDKDLKDESIHFKMNCKVFATSNSTKKLSPAFLSRMQVYNLPEYSDEEFIDVVAYCLESMTDLADAVLIAKTLIAHDLKNVRQAVLMGKTVGRGLTQEQIIKVIETDIKHSTNQVVDYN